MISTFVQGPANCTSTYVYLTMQNIFNTKTNLKRWKSIIKYFLQSILSFNPQSQLILVIWPWNYRNIFKIKVSNCFRKFVQRWQYNERLLYLEYISIRALNSDIYALQQTSLSLSIVAYHLHTFYSCLTIDVIRNNSRYCSLLNVRNVQSRSVKGQGFH